MKVDLSDITLRLMLDFTSQLIWAKPHQLFPPPPDFAD